MVGVVGDGNISAEQWLVHAFEQARTLVGDRSGGEIVKEKTYLIADCGWFEDYGVFSGCEFLRIFRHLGFFAGAGGKFLRVEVADVAGVCFGPTGGGIVLHGDGKFGFCLAVGGEEPLRICERQLRLSSRKNSGSDLTVTNGEVAGLFYG